MRLFRVCAAPVEHEPAAADNVVECTPRCVVLPLDVSDILPRVFRVVDKVDILVVVQDCDVVIKVHDGALLAELEGQLVGHTVAIRGGLDQDYLF